MGNTRGAQTNPGYRALHLVAYTDAVDCGGAEVWLASLLARLGPHVRATVMGTDPVILDYLAAHREGTATVVVPPAENKRHVGPILEHYRAFARLRPDVVQFNLIGMPGLSLYPMAAAVAVRRAKVIAVEHQPFPPYSRMSAVLLRGIERRLAAHVAVSDATARIVEENDGLARGTVRTIHNGIDEVEVHPVPKCVEGLLVGAVARLHRAKGLDVLVRAMANLPEASLAIVGRGEELEHLEQLAAEVGLDGRLHMLGWQDRPQDFIATFDVLALPSRVEPFGLVIAEAMRARVPVVASDVGGIPEVVDDGVTGLLVPRDDVEALTDALRRLLDDPALRRRMGDAGEHRFATRFTLERMVHEYEALYEEVLGR